MRSDVSGLTLIELVVTIAIAAILVAVAVPNFQQSFVNNRLTTGANDLVAAMSTARAESIKRGARVSVCRTTDAKTCASGSADWSSGWIVFVDNTTAAGNVTGVIDGTDETLRVFGTLTSMTMTAGANFASAVTYTPSGTASGVDSGGNVNAGNDVFTLCYMNGSTPSGNGRRISINATGRVSTATIGC